MVKRKTKQLTKIGKIIIIGGAALILSIISVCIVLACFKAEENPEETVPSSVSTIVENTAETTAAITAEATTAPTTTAAATATQAPAPKKTAAPTKVTPVQTVKTENPVPAGDRKVYSHGDVTATGKIVTVRDGVTYIDGILVVNKTYGLPENYGNGLVSEALNAFYKMQAAAKKDGINIFIKSDFRRYADQKYIYNNYVAKDGKAEADTYSARPGHSEHQTGLAMDLNLASSSFAGTPEAQWISENCWDYGFILRYPEDKVAITGYKYEPWHVRYVGKEVSEKLQESGQCLEEYLGIDSAYLD